MKREYNNLVYNYNATCTYYCCGESGSLYCCSDCSSSYYGTTCPSLAGWALALIVFGSLGLVLIVVPLSIVFGTKKQRTVHPVVPLDTISVSSDSSDSSDSSNGSLPSRGVRNAPALPPPPPTYLESNAQAQGGYRKPPTPTYDLRPATAMDGGPPPMYVSRPPTSMDVAVETADAPMDSDADSLRADAPLPQLSAGSLENVDVQESETTPRESQWFVTFASLRKLCTNFDGQVSAKFCQRSGVASSAATLRNFIKVIKITKVQLSGENSALRITVGTKGATHKLGQHFVAVSFPLIQIPASQSVKIASREM